VRTLPNQTIAQRPDANWLYMPADMRKVFQHSDLRRRIASTFLIFANFNNIFRARSVLDQFNQVQVSWSLATILN
jgi:hypothetical protein